MLAPRFSSSLPRTAGALALAALLAAPIVASAGQLVRGPDGRWVESTPPPVVATPPKTPAVADTKLSSEHLENMGQVIRHFGYACAQASLGFFEGKSPYGLECKVLCDSGTFQVIVTPNNQFRVQTWATRLR